MCVIWPNTFWGLVSIYLKSLPPKYHVQKCKTHHGGRKKHFFLSTGGWWNNHLQLIHDARSEGASVHEKWQKKRWQNSLKLSVSNWKLREGVFIFVTNSFEKLIIWYSSSELWKRPLHEKTPLFFWLLGDPPSDRVNSIICRIRKA